MTEKEAGAFWAAYWPYQISLIETRIALVNLSVALTAVDPCLEEADRRALAPRRDEALDGIRKSEEAVETVLQAIQEQISASVAPTEEEEQLAAQLLAAMGLIAPEE